MKKFLNKIDAFFESTPFTSFSYWQMILFFYATTFISLIVFSFLQNYPYSALAVKSFLLVMPIYLIIYYFIFKGKRTLFKIIHLLFMLSLLIAPFSLINNALIADSASLSAILVTTQGVIAYLLQCILVFYLRWFWKENYFPEDVF